MSDLIGSLSNLKKLLENLINEKDKDQIIHIIEGFEGENKIRNYFFEILKEKEGRLFQVDMMVRIEDKYYLIEVKNQEIFKPGKNCPKFYGHGLPKWQVNDRVRFYRDTGIEPFLFIVDKESTNIYYQSLIKLEEKALEIKVDYLDTNGSNPRRVYNINLFKKLES